MPDKKTTLLLILDGWGTAPISYPPENNAILSAHVPFWLSLLEVFPHTVLKCCGNAVGLPEGVMGNSEVGHLNLGAGRVVWQEIVRIDKVIEQDGLAGNHALCAAIEKVRNTATAHLHLIGLVSDGGVHSVDRHYFALLRLAKRLGLSPDRVLFHVLLDGRDTPPRSGLEYVRALEETMRRENLGRIATVGGRYWGMDRDKRWDRVKRHYDALVFAKSEFTAASAVEAVQKGYDRDENDEFIKPTLIIDAASNRVGEPTGTPVGRMRSGDQVIFFNFRPDRTRQLSHALVDETFTNFERDNSLKIELTTMTRYEEGLNAAVAFPPQDVSQTLGEIVSNAGLRQLRIAETEKYAHVTYFFSGGREREFPGETRVLIPSPKVATYDLQPEMSVRQVGERLEREILSGAHDLIVANFANGDMVGHTGKLDAAKKAVQAVDAALNRAIHAVLRVGASAIVTADHGNAEEMWNYDENCPSTQHTLNPTPMVVVAPAFPDCALRRGGCLGDVAPTALKLMSLPQPEAMTGRSLLLC